MPQYQVLALTRTFFSDVLIQALIICPHCIVAIFLRLLWGQGCFIEEASKTLNLA